MEQTTTQAVLDGVLKLVQEGGEAALWGLTIYMGFWLLRVLVIGGSICMVIHLVSRSVLRGVSLHLSHRALQFPLVSKKVTSKLSTTLDTLADSVDSSLRESETRFAGQLEKLIALVSQFNSEPEGEGEEEAGD